MNSASPLISVPHPSSDEEATQTTTRQAWRAKNDLPDLSATGARTGRAETPAEQAVAPSAGVMETAAKQTGKKRILAVDDRASNTRLVKLYLERTGNYVVREVNNPNAALSAAEEFQPQLILLDVMMPGLDGGDLAACFQASPKLKAVPIVFLTAAVTKGEVEAGGGRIGGNDFLAKPVVLTEMLNCLKRHLGG
jgi:CheY-like chemotaxis protein